MLKRFRITLILFGFILISVTGTGTFAAEGTQDKIISYTETGEVIRRSPRPMVK